MSYEVPGSVPIPSDVERPDKILAGLTARQVAIAAVAAVIIWAGFQASRHVMPLPAFAALASPVGLAAVAPGHRGAGRPAAGPAPGRRLAAAARPAPPGHRPRGHPRPARLDRPARPRSSRPRRCSRRCGGTSRPTG